MVVAGRRSWLASQAGGWRAVPGFSLEESDPIRGNFVGKTVTWRRGSSTLSALAGKRLRIHAATADAKLLMERDAGLEGERGKAARTLLYLHERDMGVRTLWGG